MGGKWEGKWGICSVTFRGDTRPWLDVATESSKLTSSGMWTSVWKGQQFLPGTYLDFAVVLVVNS